MTVRQLLLLATVRRWYVTIVGLAATALVAFAGMQAPGDYESSADLSFLAPLSTENPNGLIAGGNVISVAGVMSAVARSSTVRAELREEGLVDRYTIKLHNSGNQWADNYDRPVLDIQVIGSNPQSVARSMQLLVARVNAELLSRQRAVGSAPNNMITTQLNPTQPPVLHGTGSPMRAVAAALLGGVLVTLTFVLVVDDALVRRRLRRDAGAHLDTPPPAPGPFEDTDRIRVPAAG